MAKVSVALSGGGHRASLFALGTMQYLADAGANRDVVSVASVSGGSLTNGFIAQQLDYQGTDGATHERLVTVPFLTQLTTRGTLFAPLATKVFVAALLLLILAASIVPWMLTSIHFGWRVLLCLVGLGAALTLAWYRGAICRHAFRSTLFSPNGAPTKLADLHPGVQHVFCSTELQSGNHFYFAQNFAYGYQFGAGKPGDVDLATAVGASAALPGGFPPVTVPTKTLGLQGGHKGKDVSRLRLVDGGVYDNMGDQWAAGYGNRIKRLGASFAAAQPDELIVVNASAASEWTPTSGLGMPVIGELRALIRDQGVQYVNTTAHRRSALIDRFELATARGTGLGGAYVGIGQSANGVAEFYENDADRGARATAVLDVLEAANLDSKELRAIATESAGMSTNLSRLAPEEAAKVVWHGYVIAMCNLHVILSYQLLPLPPRARFTIDPS